MKIVQLKSTSARPRGFPGGWICLGTSYQNKRALNRPALRAQPFTKYWTSYAVSGLEITMPKINLSGMTVEALMDLRNRVDEMLVEHRAKLIGQLERIAVVGGARIVRGGGSALRGKKVPPKYR